MYKNWIDIQICGNGQKQIKYVLQTIYISKRLQKKLDKFCLYFSLLKLFWSYKQGNGSLLHEDTFARRVTFARRLFCTSVTFARTVTFAQGDIFAQCHFCTRGHFCTQGHFCTASFVHEETLFHGDIFSRWQFFPAVNIFYTILSTFLLYTNFKLKFVRK